RMLPSFPTRRSSDLEQRAQPLSLEHPGEPEATGLPHRPDGVRIPELMALALEGGLLDLRDRHPRRREGRHQGARARPRIRGGLEPGPRQSLEETGVTIEAEESGGEDQAEAAVLEQRLQRP